MNTIAIYQTPKQRITQHFKWVIKEEAERKTDYRFSVLMVALDDEAVLKSTKNLTAQQALDLFHEKIEINKTYEASAWEEEGQTTLDQNSIIKKLFEAVELLEFTAGETVKELNDVNGLDNDTTTITETARDSARELMEEILRNKALNKIVKGA